MLLGYIDPGTGFTISSAGGLLLMFLTGAFGFLLLFLKRIFKFFQRHQKPLIIILLLLAGVAMGIFHFWKQGKPIAFEKKIIIIGFDALSPRIMEPLLAQGRLPNFKRLQEEGSFCRLSTSNPPQSPVAWTEFSTGQNPGKNGVYDFIVRNPKTYKLRLSLSDTEGGSAKQVIRSPRFWQTLEKKRIPTTILTCPVTFPPDKVFGKMLSGMGVPDILGTEGTFTFYTSEREEEAETTGGKVFHIKKSPTMILNLIGPKVAAADGSADYVKVPFRVSLKDGPEIGIEFQEQKFTLKPDQWSDWQSVTFDLGAFRKTKGIMKFYLVSLEPEFKLYISPINLDPREPYFPISYPRRYSTELAEKIGLYHTQGMPFDTWALNEKRINEKIFLDMVYDILKEKERMLDTELNSFEKGVFFVYFESADIIQHMFWRYIDPQHPLYEPNAPKEYQEMINQWYIKFDGILGRIMNKISPEDTMIVLSDHGFDTFRRAVHLNSWLRENGYLELDDAGAMAGQPLLQGINWSRTKAYAIGFNAIYINEQGREGQGIVAPGTAKQQLKQELAQKLMAWVDSKTNQRIVNKVYQQEELFWGPYLEETPDLVVGFNSGYRASWQTALGDVPADLLEDNLRKWSGDHLFDTAFVPGVFFTNKKISKQTPSILDIAPSVLKLVGMSEEELKALSLDGEPLWP
jgi:predicted AlkP superfamily phosphohydrolase/phosphomutase